VATARATTPTVWAAMAARLVKDEGRTLFGLAYALTGTEAKAERLVRAAVDRTFDHVTKKTPPATVAALARRALYAQFLDEAKASEKRKGKRAKGVEEMLPVGPSRLPLIEALASLPAAERMCIVMRFYEGLSAVTIGRDIDVAVTTVRQYLTDGLDGLAAVLGDPGLDREEALNGGCSLEGEDGLPQQAPPTDAVSRAFSAVDDLVITAYRDLALATDATPVARALTRRKKRRAWVIAGLSVAAVASLAVGGWVVAQAVIPPAEVIVASPSPSVSPGPYGLGVLSADDILLDSQTWGVSGYAVEGDQRFLSCAIDDLAPKPGSDGSTLIGGDCTQRTTAVTRVSTTITPMEAAPGEDRVSVAVTVTNTGDAPIAIYRDSLSLGFELPWGALSSFQGQGDSLFSIQGPSVDDRSLSLSSVPMSDIVVLQPAEQLTVVMSVQRLLLADFQAQIDDPTSGVTQEMAEEWVRDSSAIGEASTDDDILTAFRAGEYAPRGAVFVAVAPTEQDSPRMVVLMDILPGFGVAPAPSPSPSASPSATPSASASP
jgi:DNA-directed RNA polymerase specialized sigma24 family protein